MSDPPIQLIAELGLIPKEHAMPDDLDETTADGPLYEDTSTAGFKEDAADHLIAGSLAQDTALAAAEGSGPEPADDGTPGGEAPAPADEAVDP